MTVPAPADLEIASQMPVFSGLKPRAIKVLLDQATVFSLDEGQELFRQGDPAHGFFVVMDGWIKLYRMTPTGDEAVLNVLTRGESLAEAVSFTSGRYPATARAVTPARVMMIPAKHIISCVREMPDVAIAMMASTSQNLHRMARQIEQLMAHSAMQRVAEFLASLAPCTRGRCRITLPYEKSLIASRLGLKPESLSRVFAKLRLVGVDVRASTVEVRDMAQLLRLVACEGVMPRRPVKSGAMCARSSRPPEAKPQSVLAGTGS